MEQRSKWQRWFPFALVLSFVVAIIAVADSGIARPFFDWINRHMGGDKVGHFILLGGLAFTFNRALGGRCARMGPLFIQVGGLLIGLAITCEEFSQIWIPGRTFDWGDLAANYAGIACADWLGRRWLR
jgi:hypothetical protein